MIERKAKFLLEQYPHLFSSFLKRGEHAHHQFSVDDGWYPIIFDICSKIFVLQCKAELNCQKIIIDCQQMKEKLGGLRFYYRMELEGETKSSKIFRTVDEWVRTKMCRWKLYKQYWAIYRFRRKHIYETMYEKIGAIVSEGESLSYRTCEVCGGIGNRCSPNGHWIETLCKRHEKEAESKREEGEW